MKFETYLFYKKCGLILPEIHVFRQYKGIVRVTSSDPPYKDGNARFKTVHLKPYNLISNVEYFCFSR